MNSTVGVGAATGDKFELGVKQVDRAAGVELLEQVQKGEVGLDQYLQTRVDDAVRHLESTLTTEQLSFVKQELLEQLRSDPVLIELVRRTTGQSPEINEP